ncbi:hypothetical protein LEP1GSC083_0090 [Leptospira interrogans serovar Pyrogenes str. L0374]|uniref:Uncharacterized protein n=1 Tax=Leptospira interrogans serovar Pyrogenes str. L0374 TaxID=1049928 RepID=M6K821_LEPIR|nr:hypothetical protein LEP1GSC083_0090 [Leptospira interrogans serovar Pyrogenes str. L0374]
MSMKRSDKFKMKKIKRKFQNEFHQRKNLFQNSLQQKMI